MNQSQSCLQSIPWLGPGLLNITEAARNKIDPEIELKDIETGIGNLKPDKYLGVTEFTNKFHKKFCKDLNIWILQYIHYTEERGQQTRRPNIKCDVSTVHRNPTNKTENNNLGKTVQN